MNTITLSRAGSLRAALARALQGVMRAAARRRAERQAAARLHAMTDRQLADIGLHRGQIDAAVHGYRRYGE